MATLGMIEYADASPEVLEIYDDIMATRKTDSDQQFLEGACHESGDASHGPGKASKKSWLQARSTQ